MRDDTISRQAAIEIIDMLFKKLSKDYVDMMGIGYNHAVGDAIAILKGLPSAQPEIIRCKDCKHYNAGFECLIEGYGIERDKEWYCGDAERREE